MENDGYMEPYEAQKMMAGKVEGITQRPLFTPRVPEFGVLCSLQPVTASAPPHKADLGWVMVLVGDSHFAGKFSQFYPCVLGLQEHAKAV